jgi:hypothetical protein
MAQHGMVYKGEVVDEGDGLKGYTALDLVGPRSGPSGTRSSMPIRTMPWATAPGAAKPLRRRAPPLALCEDFSRYRHWTLG